MPRGRRAEPAAIKRAKGNPGRRKIAEPAQLPIDAASVAALIPDDMTGEQRTIWAKYAPDLERMQLLKSTDRAAFQRYCAFLALFFKAERAIRDTDLVIETQSEHVTMERRSKWLDSMLLLDRRLVEMEDRFGMNPSARQRIFLQLSQAQAQPGLPGMTAPPEAAKHPADASDSPMFAGGTAGAATPVGMLSRLN